MKSPAHYSALLSALRTVPDQPVKQHRDLKDLLMVQKQIAQRTFRLAQFSTGTDPTGNGHAHNTLFKATRQSVCGWL